MEQWKDKSIPDEVHESRKKNGEYNKGIAIITGQNMARTLKENI